MRYVIATVLLNGVVSICFGDTLLTTDGRKFEGTLIEQSESAVVFEVSRAGASTRITLDPRQVLKITKGPIDPPPTPAPKAAPNPATKPAAVQSVALADAPPAPPPVEKYSGPTYYVIPLRGEVGATFTAS